MKLQKMEMGIIASVFALFIVATLSGWFAFAAGMMRGHMAMGSGMLLGGVTSGMMSGGIMAQMHGAMAAGTSGVEHLPETDPEADLETIEASVQLDEWMLSPSVLELEVNKRLVLTIENKGTVAHAFVIPEMGVRVGPLAPGTVYTVAIDLTSSGSYDAYCDIPGHRQLGQSGTLLVRGGTAPRLGTGEGVMG